MSIAIRIGYLLHFIYKYSKQTLAPTARNPHGQNRGDSSYFIASKARAF